MSEAGATNLVEYIRICEYGERPAVEAGAYQLSYDDLIRLVDGFARFLRDAGVVPGERILVSMPNSAEQVVAVLGVISAGAIAVPVDIEAGRERQSDVVRQTEPRFVLTCMDQSVPENLQAVRLRIDPDTVSVDCLVDGQAPAPVSTGVTGEPAAFIRFTSGSTGQAKGVVLTHAQQLWTSRMLSGYFHLDAGHRELLLVSMALSGGWQRIAATLFGGGCVILAERPLSVGDLLASVVSTRATGFFTPPPLVRMLLAGPADKVERALHDCRSIEIGSAAITGDELRAFIALVPGARVYVHYGLTECSRAVILDTRSDPDRLASVGKPAPAVELKIVDEQGAQLGPDRVGQIMLRGPQLTTGYWQQAGLNRACLADGWLATGDYGSVDRAGFLTLAGRQDDLINCGGHCFFPDEVEQALGMPEGVEQYLIAGVDDPRGVLQQVPWAFVVPLNADDWTPKSLLAQARQRLPAHMVPRRVVVVAELPLTPSGKPNRRETAKLYGSGA